MLSLPHRHANARGSQRHAWFCGDASQQPFTTAAADYGKTRQRRHLSHDPVGNTGGIVALEEIGGSRGCGRTVHGPGDLSSSMGEIGGNPRTPRCRRL